MFGVPGGGFPGIPSFLTRELGPDWDPTIGRPLMFNIDIGGAFNFLWHGQKFIGDTGPHITIPYEVVVVQSPNNKFPWVGVVVQAGGIQAVTGLATGFWYSCYGINEKPERITQWAVAHFIG